MTEEATGQQTQWVAQAWAERLAEALEAMAGERPAVECHPSSEAAEDLLWWEQSYHEGPHAALWAGAAEADWMALGGWVLRSAGIEEARDAECRNTFLEILSQATASLAQVLAEQAHAPVKAADACERAPQDRAAGYAVDVKIPGADIVTVWFTVATWPPELVEQPVTALGPARPALPEASEQPMEGTTLPLLMGVELPVSVSFGRAELPLKDILKLTTGSIVELNRGISEPVEVIVNNCVIARGEVVVIEGNYGVRIQEIISREKRLRTFR